ncbi:single-stranded DNA-binding protein [Streptomyces sp. NPDC056337]|uniref:single-stranded DNA-binding protein n=1 Tax=Streptomyces sp. NPDC056337 TaxID=3345787 RepID=UPI0035DF52D8
MALPTMTGVGRLVDDPELRFTQSGKAVATVRLAFNSRRLNQQTQQWEDGDVFWIRGTLWEKLAENASESLEKGMEVLVSGELRTESWEKDGQKHSQPSLLVRSIAPNLAYATAQVTKANAGGQQQGGGQQRSAPQQQRRQGPPQDDPWATGPATASQGSGYDSDEPPF